MKEVQLDINGEIIGINVDGDSYFGEEEVLLAQDDDLSINADWHDTGYTVVPFLTKELFKTVFEGITNMIRGFVEKETGKPAPNFTLEKYHEYCGDDELHLAVVEHFRRCLPVEQFPIDYRLVEERVSDICGINVTTQHPSPTAFAKFFCIRIVRPQRNTDNNPPHRDVWISQLRNALNMYLPLAGSNYYSSLPVIPGSHFWKESDIERSVSGSKVNKVAFVVPSVVGSKHGMKMIRPVPKQNEVLIFSPYLIHGGGNNLNKDATRVSIEMRFWRKIESDKSIILNKHGSES